MQEMSESASRWDRRRAETFRRLLEAGERLFRVHGFDATTVEEVAVAADVAKGTFFNYFASKEALLGEVLRARLLSVLERTREPRSSPQDQIWELLVAARHELAPYLHLFRRMFSYAVSHPGTRPTGHRHLTLAQVLEQIIRDGQASGALRPQIDAEVAGGLIATLFFRLSVMECVNAEGRAPGGPCLSGDQQHQPDAPAFCWESQMRAGLQILYHGLVC